MSIQKAFIFRSIYKKFAFWVGPTKIQFHEGQYSTDDQKIAGEIRNQMRTRYNGVVTEVSVQPKPVAPEAPKLEKK
jgi:hypothetical protein